MALLTSPFLGVAATQPATATGTSLTYTFSTAALGYPAARITNVGTAGANIFVQFIATTNTVTVGVTNAQPILAGQSAILATGGANALGFVSNSTTTLYITTGQGGTGA